MRGRKGDWQSSWGERRNLHQTGQELVCDSHRLRQRDVEARRRRYTGTVRSPLVISCRPIAPWSYGVRRRQTLPTSSLGGLARRRKWYYRNSAGFVEAAAGATSGFPFAESGVIILTLTTGFTGFDFATPQIPAKRGISLQSLAKGWTPSKLLAA